MRSRLLVGVGASALILAACAEGGPPTSPSAVAGESASAPPGEPSSAPSPTPREHHVGISSVGADDGWNEALVCSMRAEAGAGGVSRLTVSNRVTDGAGQAADIRNLIAVGVEAVVINPDRSDDELTAAVREAIDAGIVVVGVNQPVAEEGAYLMATDQEEYGYLGARWLFEAMGGKGNVVYMRGKAGDPVDDQRDAGFKRALAESPDIKVVAEIPTDWDQAVAVEQLNAFLATEQKFGGIWTSGVDSVVVDALKIAGSPYVPIVGADNGAFVSQLLSEDGLDGAAVTNPAAVGGAAVRLALQVLDGGTPAEPEVLIDPQVWDNTTDAGRAQLAKANDPDIGLSWPLQISIPGWTTYAKDELLACEGRGG